MRKYLGLLAAPALVWFVAVGVTAGGDDKKDDPLAGWTHDFSAEKADLVASGRNPYLVLEPGYLLILEDGNERLTITVKDQTKTVDGVECRVVEQKETRAIRSSNSPTTTSPSASGRTASPISGKTWAGPGFPARKGPSSA